MGYRILKPLFPLGNVYLTAGVAALELEPDKIVRLLHRHQCGDWGDLDDEDKLANDRDLKCGERLLSRLRHGGWSALCHHRAGSVDDHRAPAERILKAQVAQPSSSRMWDRTRDVARVFR